MELLFVVCLVYRHCHLRSAIYPTQAGLHNEKRRVHVVSSICAARFRGCRVSLRRIGEIDSHPLRLILVSSLAARSSLRFFLEIEIAQPPAVGTTHYEASGLLLDYPRRREAAWFGHLVITRTQSISTMLVFVRHSQNETPGGKMPTPSLVFNASKVLIGNTNSPKLVIVAAVIVLVWMFMDVCQFVDWLQTKINSSTGLPFPI